MSSTVSPLSTFVTLQKLGRKGYLTVLKNYWNAGKDYNSIENQIFRSRSTAPTVDSNSCCTIESQLSLRQFPGSAWDSFVCSLVNLLYKSEDAEIEQERSILRHLLLHNGDNEPVSSHQDDNISNRDINTTAKDNFFEIDRKLEEDNNSPINHTINNYLQYILTYSKNDPESAIENSYYNKTNLGQYYYDVLKEEISMNFADYKCKNEDINTTECETSPPIISSVTCSVEIGAEKVFKVLNKHDTRKFVLFDEEQFIMQLSVMHSLGTLTDHVFQFPEDLFDRIKHLVHQRMGLHIYKQTFNWDIFLKSALTGMFRLITTKLGYLVLRAISTNLSLIECEVFAVDIFSYFATIVNSPLFISAIVIGGCAWGIATFLSEYTSKCEIELRSRGNEFFEAKLKDGQWSLNFIDCSKVHVSVSSRSKKVVENEILEEVVTCKSPNCEQVDAEKLGDYSPTYLYFNTNDVFKYTGKMDKVNGAQDRISDINEDSQDHDVHNYHMDNELEVPELQGGIIRPVEIMNEEFGKSSQFKKEVHFVASNGVETEEFLVSAQQDIPLSEPIHIGVELDHSNLMYNNTPFISSTVATDDSYLMVHDLIDTATAIDDEFYKNNIIVQSSSFSKSENEEKEYYMVDKLKVIEM